MNSLKNMTPAAALIGLALLVTTGHVQAAECGQTKTDATVKNDYPAEDDRGTSAAGCNAACIASKEGRDRAPHGHIIDLDD